MSIIRMFGACASMLTMAIRPLTAPETCKQIISSMSAFEITNYDKLPTNFKIYIDYLETKLNLKIKIVSVGPDRKQTIFR